MEGKNNKKEEKGEKFEDGDKIFKIGSSDKNYFKITVNNLGEKNEAGGAIGTENRLGVEKEKRVAGSPKKIKTIKKKAEKRAKKSEGWKTPGAIFEVVEKNRDKEKETDKTSERGEEGKNEDRKISMFFEKIESKGKEKKKKAFGIGGQKKERGRKSK